MPAADRERDPRLLTGLVAFGVAFVLVSVAAPPDPFARLLALPVALAVSLPGAGWLVYRRGYDGPDVSLPAWVVPALVPVRLLRFLVVFVPLALPVGRVAGAFPGPVGVGVESLGLLAAFLAGQWVGFHGGWRALGARFRGLRPRRADD